MVQVTGRQCQRTKRLKRLTPGVENGSGGYRLSGDLVGTPTVSARLKNHILLNDLA
jgi:hypothetical protein